jgi:hypothetical protein
MAVKKNYFWSGIKMDVWEYVFKKNMCQIIKAKHIKIPSSLQPLGVHNNKWESINMDFLVGLFRNEKGHEHILWSLTDS